MSLLPILGAKSFTPLLDSAHVWVSQLSPLALLWLIIMALVAVSGLIRLLVKGHKLKAESSADTEFLDDFASSEQPLSVYLAHRQYKHSPSFRCYHLAVKELCLLLVGAHTVNSELVTRLRAAGKISPTQMDSIRYSLNAAIGKNQLLVRKNAGDGAGISLLALGSAGTCILAMEQTLFDHAGWHALPALLPLTLAILCALVIRLWQMSQEHKNITSQIRLREFAAGLLANLDRLFVDHRRPLDSLPSLAGMSFSDGPSFSQSPAEKPPGRSV